MASDIPIILKLQADALDQDIPVATLLRTAKIIATKLNLTDALVWIDRELDGYMDIPIAELPKYRRLTGQPKGFNPYHGWQTIQYEDADTARFYAQAPIGQALGSIEEGLRTKKDRKGLFTFPYPPEIKAQIFKSLNHLNDVANFIDHHQLWGIVDAVRNLILNWTLELEKAGVVGENMTFTADEKREASPVSQNFFAQNVSVFGNASGNAQVSIQQTGTVTLDIERVRSFLGQVRTALPILPDSIRGKVEAVLAETEATALAKTPDQAGLRKLLTSLRTICEGATGNLVAEGIVRLIDTLCS